LARYIGSVCRLCRREGTKLFLKAERCSSYKCAMEKRPFAPGQHGASKKFKVSEYGLQLREKQKAKRFYGVLETQFKRYFEMAEKMSGRTGENLLVLIERRLDNVLIKSGLFKSKQTARQFITHGHILINGKKLDIPSYLVKEGDLIKVSDTSKEILVIKKLKEETEQTFVIPSWLTMDLDKLEVKVVRIPNREDITVQINEQLIVELYSK
jgi:small subunit ribosomal protein S4